MKRSQKITLASLAGLFSIMSVVLTIVEKSISIVNSLKVEVKASSVPKDEIVEKGLAVGIETDRNKTIARRSK